MNFRCVPHYHRDDAVYTEFTVFLVFPRPPVLSQPRPNRFTRFLYRRMELINATATDAPSATTNIYSWRKIWKVLLVSLNGSALVELAEGITPFMHRRGKHTVAGEHFYRRHSLKPSKYGAIFRSEPRLGFHVRCRRYFQPPIEFHHILKIYSRIFRWYSFSTVQKPSYLWFSFFPAGGSEIIVQWIRNWIFYCKSC